MTSRARILLSVAAMAVVSLFTACTNAVDGSGGVSLDGEPNGSSVDDLGGSGAEADQLAGSGTGASNGGSALEPTDDMAVGSEADDVIDTEPDGDGPVAADLAMFEEPATEPDQESDDQVDPEDGYVAPQVALDPVESVLCATIEIAHDGAVDGESKLLAEQRARLIGFADQVTDAILGGHVADAAEADPSGDGFVQAVGAALDRCLALGYDG